MAKKRLPADVLAYFRREGAKGGQVGGKMALVNMTPAERSARAKKASLAAVAVRRAKARRASE